MFTNNKRIKANVKTLATIDSHEWRQIIIPLRSTIQQAIDSLEKSGMQIVVVVSESNKLCGTITDGDIRRSFLKGLNLGSHIDDVIQRNPLVAPISMSRDHVLQLMRINMIRQVPIVAHDGEVVGLHIMDTVLAPNNNKNIIIVMAGGKGSRLGSETESCPKPMLKIGGKPMLQKIIEKAQVEGFQNFVVSLHYLGYIIEDFFGDGSRFGVQIDYIREESPLSTAGCLSLLPTRPELPFVVTNGDVLTDISYKKILEFHTRHKTSATMAVREYAIQNQFGTVEIEDIDIIGFEEKPVYRSYVNAGVYVLQPDVLKHLEYNHYCTMPALFERIRKSSCRTIVYPMHEDWLDIGRPEDLVSAREKLK